MNTVCASCLATNGLPDDRINDAPKCGCCGEPLLDGSVIHATDATLDKLRQDDLPIVIYFWALWCGPCVGFAPVFDAVAGERRDKVRFIKINTEAEPALSTRFGIRSITTIMLFKQRQKVDLLHGAMPKALFEEWLDEGLSLQGTTN